MHRPIATCVVWRPVPLILFGSGKKPWHTPYLEVHVMGIERSMFRNEFCSDRYNNAVGIEWMYRGMGLVTFFGLN